MHQGGWQLHCYTLIMKVKAGLHASLLALAVLAAATPVAAAPSAEQMTAYEAASETDRAKLLITLAKSGRADDVNALLAAFPLTGKHAKNRNQFIAGLLLKSEGDLTGAVDVFRSILADDANLTLVRAELAQTLMVLEQDDSAKHHFELLANDAPDAQAAGGVRSFIDQIDNRTPLTKSAYVSIAPSTNVNGGSRHNAVYDIGIPGAGLQYTQPESGIGAAVGGSLGYSKRLGNHFSLVAAGNAEARLFKNSDFNSYGLSQSLELRRLIEKGHVGFGVIAKEAKDSGFSYVNYGPRLSLSLQATQRDHLSGSATYEWRNNLEKSATDSTAVMLNTSWTHGFTSSLTTTVFSGYDYVNTGSDPTTYGSLSAGISVYKELPFGISTTLSAQASNTQFVGINTSLGDKRHDVRGTGAITLTKRDFNIFGFAPSVQYTFSENFSNMEVYDIQTHAVDFRLTKDF
jgi:outer membrane protein